MTIHSLTHSAIAMVYDCRGHGECRTCDISAGSETKMGERCNIIHG